MVVCGMVFTALLVTLPALIASQSEAQRVILEGVDRYQNETPFEGVRVILSYLGEEHSPAYICGISGAAFRIGGPCVCGPEFDQAMYPTELVSLLGYKCEQIWLGGEDPESRLQEILARAREEIRDGRPVLMFHTFTNLGWDVVCGFDDGKRELYGRGACEGLEEYARAEQTHPLKSPPGVPMMGAIFIGEKVGQLDVREAELASLKEAVAHAHSATGKCAGRYDHLASGLECYDAWIAGHRFYGPPGIDIGINVNSYMLSTLRTARAAASLFMLELGPKYPQASTHLEMAAEHFAREAEALDSCYKLFPERTQEELDDTDRRIRAAAYLRQARAMYALAIDEIARSLAKISMRE